MSVLMETTLGTFVVDLYTDERPKTAANFLKLCKMKFYNFCLFHSVEEGYIAQCGVGKEGERKGNSSGGSSVYGLLYGDQARFIPAEELPKIKHTRRGQLSMVQNADGAIGSQFFLTLDEGLDYLDGRHTVIGHLAEGEEILDKLNAAIVDEEKRPYQDIRLLHTIILHDPFPDPKGLDPPSRSPSPDAALLKSGRIGVEEALDEMEGLDEGEVREFIEAKEATARANLLTIIGDLHDADELPPDNVLFVCKLNPVTTDQDLEIIFARFGAIKKCEIIKDRKSGASLQYAFVEFERPEDCEQAYFKMDNVLIDDRRIHVDFSQSVSKNSSWFDKFQRDLGGRRRKEEGDGKGRDGSSHSHSKYRRHRSPSPHSSKSRRRRHSRSPHDSRSHRHHFSKSSSHRSSSHRSHRR